MSRPGLRPDRILPLPRMAAPTRVGHHRRRPFPAHRHDEAPGIATAPTAREIQRLHRALAARDSLAPGPEVDGLFGRLVELVVALDVGEAAALMADPGVRALRPRLQALCATGETELERAWAARVAGADAPEAELRRFPYAENYRRLSELEWSAMTGTGGRPRRIAFVGAGPLPLSALYLARRPGVRVACYDRDEHAVVLAHRLVRALGAAGVAVHAGDTDDCPDLSDHDAVVLAALVGATTAAKREAVANVRARMAPGALLAARSAHGARTLLYPVLDLDALVGFDLLNVVHPFDQVINSVVLARRRDPSRPDAWAAAPAPNNEVRPWPDS